MFCGSTGQHDPSGRAVRNTILSVNLTEIIIRAPESLWQRVIVRGFMAIWYILKGLYSYRPKTN